MKSLKKIIAISFLLIGFTVISQENTQTEIAIINQNLIDYKLTTSISQSQTNSAIITQIGNQNHNQNTIIANQSIIQVVQNGHFNSTDIYRVEAEVNKFIIQNGNRNTIHEMSIGNYNTIDNQYIQNGDNNRITSFGSNTISENLKIQINGNNASVIVINR
jgi:major curlin subunit